MSRLTGQPFAQSYVELHKVREVQFGLLAPEEVQQMSVVKIDNDRIYDDKGLPTFGAINDPRMGTMDKEVICYTCKGNHQECPGHFGHIELVLPVFHGGLIEYIRKVLRCVCYHCAKLLIDKSNETAMNDIKRTKNYQARFGKVLRICDPIKECREDKGGCGQQQPKFTKSGLKIIIEYPESAQQLNGASQDRKQIYHPDEALRVLERISDEDCELMGFRPKISRPENMIIKNLAVAPPPVRPSVAMSSTNRSEDDLTYAYQAILKTNTQLAVQIRRGVNQTTINELRANLQYFVATLMDNEILGQPTQKHKSGKPLKAIRSRLRGKEGRLRGNLMGKRVDFSSRSVITPDPILQLDQLGVPKQIAMNLTVPETVTSENIDVMRRLVQNGPNTWPGAKYILRHDDRQVDLASLKNRSDAHLAPGYKVERHLMNDDYVIFNRQPSLHKMSLMGHRVKVLPFSTFRLNLSVTTPYNADFDGDEMNMHVPQSYETMAEVKEIMAVPNQIVSPKDNKPVMGIVQDALLGVMLFTMRDTFVEKELFMNLLMWVGYNGSLPTPAIIKPKPLWTGKQIFSIILPEINISRMPNDKSWACAEDKNLFIQKGELLCGNLNKSNIGSSSGGIIHVTWKELGPYPTRDFMSKTQLLINNWLHQTGFTVGVQDIIASKKTLSNIRGQIADKMKQVDDIMSQAQTGKLKQQPGKTMMESFEFEINTILNAARDDAGNTALKDLFSWNRLKAMVTAGSKGSNLNISQIMACVGQQNVEGKRIPFGFHQRSLPHFSKDDFGPESRGFVENCYLVGLTPQEFFFHAMGGREGLIDTAVKTAETGYIQRRLIKALEDVMVQYDGTVRTSKHQVIQFLYGEDGMAGEYIEDMKIGLMSMDNRKIMANCSFLPQGVSTQEQERIISQSVGHEIAQQIVADQDLALKLNDEYKQLMKDRDDLRNIILKKQGDEVHLAVNIPRIIWNSKVTFGLNPNSKTDLKPDYVLERLTQVANDLTAIPGINVRQDPLILQAKENSTWLFKIYMRSLLCTKAVIQNERLSKNAFDFVLGEIKSFFDKAISHPGEMVGPIAAQSIGEPATQMTLNTFHNAGVSSKNVTLGVPRLKEIINVAKNIKTPSMKIFLVNDLRKSESAAAQLGGKIEYTTLQHIVKQSQIFYDPDPLNTVVKEDQELVDFWNDTHIDGDDLNLKASKWLMRFVLDFERVNFKNLEMGFIDERFQANFQNQFHIMHSDTNNSEKLVFRLRMYNLEEADEDDVEMTTCMFLKENMDKLLTEMTLKGFPEITKVSFSKYPEIEYDLQTGEEKTTKDNWMIETDGVALQKVMGCSEEVNFKKTTSNDIQEILRVLGIEAVRLSLINELRFVLGSYGIYVNYRHLSTLCDVMTQRGILTSITRHGINRVDTGPLRKCSFEETVEILYEAAVFAETDTLSGITENIIMGQLAPYGTGCFDLVIDQDVLNKFAQLKLEDEIDDDANAHDGDTPMIEHLYTPEIGRTPMGDYGGGAGGQTAYSVYGGGMTPLQMMSPAYGGQTPGYMSPGAATPGMSPGYNNQPYQSPIYQTGGAGFNPASRSPAYANAGSSPSYSPTNSRQSPSYNQITTPAYIAGPAGIRGGMSPAYNSSQGQSRVLGSTPYTPNSINAPSHMTPTYQAGTPNYNRQAAYSPSYSPTQHMPINSPRYQATSSPRYSISNPASSSIHQTPAMSSPGNLYVPSATPPQYAPHQTPPQGGTQPAYPTYMGGSPINDSNSEHSGGSSQHK